MAIRKKRNFHLGLLVAPVAMAASGFSYGYEIKAGETTATIYGTAMLDVTLYSGANNGSNFNYTSIAVDGEHRGDGNIDMNAYRSRFGFTTSTPTALGPFTTKIEGDFFGGSGTFRIRQAYGEWDNILAGQTWINFGSFLGAMPVINFVGMPGGPRAHRQTQFRYSWGNFHAALENPKDRGGTLAAIDSSHGVTTSTAKSRLPDLTLRYEDDKGDFNYAVSGLLRSLEYDAQGFEKRTDNWSDDKALGWGLGLSAAWNATDKLTLHGAFTTGTGVGGYVNGSPLNTPAYVSTKGNLETIDETGFTVSGTYKIGPGKIGLGYGQVKLDLDDAKKDKAYTGTLYDASSSVFLNYIWSPLKNITYGVETGYHTVDKATGESGDEMTLEGMIMYSF